ncbi:Ureidoglycolate lyase [Symmachiella macrocystis]|uniref:Ureidoglycolate lyase n=1 Tax=Symmachiella macrocystis TaxID=2527985 RepID=A0A5C6BSY8_9PLAN|nr:fumarylacetoacetate hydrolase family protein [Symmachiella macrocystis]TWU14827.1 Ureidoglycolate lyase [Symmachiella macrocystis]
MHLATLRTNAGDRAVAVIENQYVDLQAADPTLANDMVSLLSKLPQNLKKIEDAVERAAAAGEFVTGELLAPIPRPGKVICIGLNYRDHAVESNAPIPDEPICFSKFSSSVIGPEETIVLPAACKTVDYEAELVIVIGRGGRNISRADAFAHVAGYTVGNDVSARDWQIGRPGGQWLLGKTPDTFAPIGPYVVTADQVENPHELAISLRLNGETMQDSSTKELIFGVDEIIAHISQLFSLEPGDIIFTGTPPGVGMARKPPVFLKDGDVTEVEIEGLGVLKNSVKQH